MAELGAVDQGEGQRTDRRWGWAWWLVLAVLCAAAGWWGGSTVGRPAVTLPATAIDAAYVVQSGTISKSISLLAAGSFTQQSLARSASSGTVTGLKVAAGQQVSAGDVVMTIDLRPVVIAQGTTPMFRDLQRGDSGADVDQLRKLLNTQGFKLATSGAFDAAVQSAVQAWQTRFGVPADGVVRAGDVVFTPQLPVRVSPADDITIGAAVSPGTPILDRIAAEPTVQLHYSVDQAGVNPRSGDVTVSVKNYTWRGKMGSPTEKVDGEVYIPLEAAGGGPICAADCEKAIPPGDATLLSVTVGVVAPATGPVVPVAALITGPDNSTSLRGEDGSTIKVAVRTVANGLAVIDGVEVGAVILVPGTGSS